MFTLPAQIQEIMVAFALLFTNPVFHHAQVQIVGAILARGKRTVTSALRAVGLSRERHFTNYPVFSTARFGMPLWLPKYCSD